jgi:hypothetical protein
MTSILKTDEIQSQNGGAVVKMQTLKHPSASGNNLVLGSDGSATIGQISSSTVFPAGHIVQSVFNPTITNTSTSANSSTTASGKADVIGQITIASGNGVLIYVMCPLYITGNTNCYGRVEVNEGTVASLGTKLSTQRLGLGIGGSITCDANIAFFAYDSSPADTTPDYAISIAKDSSGTTSCQVANFDADKFKIFLFEVKQ